MYGHSAVQEPLAEEVSEALGVVVSDSWTIMKKKKIRGGFSTIQIQAK